MGSAAAAGLLLLAAALAQDPGLEERVGRLVGELASDDPAVRERAEAGLAEEGVPAVPLLRKWLSSSADEEVRARLEGILAGLSRTPAEAAAAHGRERLEGRYGPRSPEDPGMDPQIRHPLAAEWIPDLALFTGWNQEHAPSDRILLGVLHRTRRVVPLSSWREVVPYLRPARTEAEIGEASAVVASLFGTCRLCAVPEAGPGAFRVRPREGGGFRAEGEFDQMARADLVHASCSWSLEFDAGGRLLSFEGATSYRTLHE